jgi:hypothetical protein
MINGRGQVGRSVRKAIGTSARRAALGVKLRLARRALRRVAGLWVWRRWSYQGVPILFANSFPKSGTHLLTQVLQGFTRLGPAVDSGLPAVTMFKGDTGKPCPPEVIQADLDRLLPGDIAYGHLYAEPYIRACLARTGMAAYFILRDPRDVVVSHVHYVTEMAPEHFHHRYYAEVLQSFSERLVTSILGRSECEEPFPDIRTRFEPYLGWLEQPGVQILRYEDFLSDRAALLGRVIDQAVERGFPLVKGRAEAVACLEAGLDPRRSPTFRTGKAGAWREQFTPAHKQLFKQVTGDLLVRLGYETDDNW